MKVADRFELNLTLSFNNKENHNKDIFYIGDDVYIQYKDCNNDIYHVDGSILTFNDKTITIVKKDKINVVRYEEIITILKY